MEIKNIYWREDALSNMKDILTSFRPQRKKFVKRVIDEIVKNINAMKSRPYIGYVESSMTDQPQKIYSHFVSHKGIKALYYTEGDTLYIIDFWDD